MKYLVLHVRPYSFESKEGRRIEGATVTYLDPDTPIDQGEVGLPPLQITVPLEIARQLPQAPGYYQMKFAQRRGKQNRPVLSVVGARHLGPVNLDTQKAE